MSRSPGPRKDSGLNDGEAEDKRGRRRGSHSQSPGGSSPRRQRSPRSPRDYSDRGERNNNRPQRRGDSGSQERGGDRGDLGPYTQVYVTGFSRSSRREDLERHFARNGADIREVVMKSRFAFIEFNKPEDAAVAVRELDRTDFEGRQLTV